MPDVTMPRLSDSMEEGTILRWLKRSGEVVRRGDELAEIETDKATETVTAEADGILEVVVGEGTTLPVGAVIARLAAGRIPASPLARRLAREGGVALHGVAGSGPGGRILGADVVRSEPAAPPVVEAPEPVAPAAAGSGAKGEVTIVAPTRPQQLVARRIAEVRATVPESMLSTEVDLEAGLSALGQLGVLDLDAVPGTAELVIRACALALREVPRANASYRDAQFELYGAINIGMTVTAQGSLVTPTIFDADRKSLTEIAVEAQDLAARARDGRLNSPQVGNATFTVLDAGPQGPDAVTPAVAAPQAAALGVGAVAPRAVVRDGEVVVRRTAQLTLVCDHRILYGEDAARLLDRIRTWLQHPAALLAAG